MPNYTKREEDWNIYTHLFGAILSIVALVLLLVKAVPTGNVAKIVSFTCYGLSMLLLFVISTVYHATKNPETRVHTQKMDHLTINILIAGSNFPLLVGALNNNLGYILMGVVGGLSIISIVLNCFDVKKFRTPSMICYILTGWMSIFVIDKIYMVIGDGVWFLFTAGFFYMVGLIFYAIHKEFMHSIWHIFVLLGALFIFLTIYLYI